ncbi:MAG: oxidoreductase [Acidimicrobiia bacterium]|nr:oxidoreductase [Acidimicrobiia bacterium]
MTLPTLAVFKFSSCDGCQLALLDLEDELLDLAGAVRITHFLEATTTSEEGPYDVALVEGSISRPDDIERIEQIRADSRTLIAIGACATAGGIQALRNAADVQEYLGFVYPRPELIDVLAASSPASAYVEVDFELRGCPINKRQLLEVVAAHLAGRKPVIPTYSVCVECKQRSVACVLVASGEPCLGPVTRAGCGAICPAYGRGCYGCFGAAETVNITSLRSVWEAAGVDPARMGPALSTFNVASRGFTEAREALDA